jgi:hypothetical protein
VSAFSLLLLSVFSAAESDKSAVAFATLPQAAQPVASAALGRHNSTYPVSVQLASLTSSLSQGASEFGTSVAASGNTAVVGALYSLVNVSGAAFVFTKPKNGWVNMTQAATLIPSDKALACNFGGSVAISGNTIVVGASQNGYACGLYGAGAAYVYVEPAGGWTGILTETAKLTAADGLQGDALGMSVSISGDTIVAGAPGTLSFTTPGSAYLFVKPANGWTNMTQTAKLTASDGVVNDGLGASVSISGNTVLAGASGIFPSSTPGFAYVFLEPTNGWTNMTQTAKLTASDAVQGDALGASVSISGNTVASGAPNHNSGRGAAYVFVRPFSGWTNMTQTAELPSSIGSSIAAGMGTSVATDSETVIAGAPYFSPGPIIRPGYSAYWREGAAFVFLKPKSGWANASQSAHLTGSDARNASYLGSSVAVNSEIVIAGAPYLSHYSGAAYVFLRPRLCPDTPVSGE